jgi:hypothetical protein
VISMFFMETGGDDGSRPIGLFKNKVNQYTSNYIA